MRTLFVLLLRAVCLCSVISIPAASAAEAASALAGFGEVDITPPVGIALGGRGCREATSDDILDPLLAHVTILKDADQNMLVIVSLDLIGMPDWLSDWIRTEIVGDLNLPLDHVILNVSHTHSGPMMYREIMAGCGQARDDERKYMLDLVRKVTEMTSAAAGHLEPVTVHIHDGKCDVGINRRGKTASGNTAMIPNPDGPYDPAVWIMRLASAKGKTRAVLFSYACHPVIVYGYGWTKISGEYPSVARREIRAALGEDVHAQFLQGPAGNIRPRCLGDLEKRKFRKAKPEDKENAGKELASAVLVGLKFKGRPLTLDLDATMERVYLKRGTPPSKAFYEKIAKTKKDYTADAARYWLEQYEKGVPFSKGSEWPVGVIRLAKDQWILYLAGEPVVQWAAHARKWFGDKPVVVWGYTQQVLSYLPVDEILDDGGYEVTSSNYYRVENPAPFAPGLNAAVRKSVLRQVGQIEGKAE